MQLRVFEGKQTFPLNGADKDTNFYHLFNKAIVELERSEVYEPSILFFTRQVLICH